MNVGSEIPAAAAVRPRSDAVLLVLCGAIFLDSLDISMTGVALPAIRSALGMSAGSLQWIVSAYVLGYGGFLLLGGRVADLFGRRRVFVASLAGKAASPRGSLYSSTKFGLRGFALGLRADMAPAGVGVSIVAPGLA